MGPTKAPGPDGFPALFFQQYWHIVGEEVTSFCLDYLNRVNINGKRGEIFQSSRGLRQGDPLSPFLFLICSEGLSALMRLSLQEGKLKGVRASRKGLGISHLLFADDCILFTEATTKGLRVLKGVMKEYED